MEEVVRTATEAASGMGAGTLIGLIVALVAVITALVEIIKALIQRKMNPLNGTLVRLDSSVGQLNTTLTKVEMRTADSDRVLENHTEKLILFGATMTQLAANEARQTAALLALKPALETSLTGCATRITEHCNDRSKAVIRAVEKGLDKRD